MVARTVALDRKQVAAVVVGVVDGQIEPEASGSELGGHLVVVLQQRPGHRSFEGAVHSLAGGRRHVRFTGLRKLEKPLQYTRARTPDCL